MKNKKTITVGFRTMIPTDGIEATAVNLRSHSNGVVETVGNPSAMGQMLATDTLVGCDLRDGRTYFFVGHNTALVLLGYNANGTFTAIGQTIIEADEIRGMTSAGDFVVVATGSGLEYLHYDNGTYTHLGTAPQMPTVAVSTTDLVTLRETLSSSKLSGEYPTWRGGLVADDATAMIRQATTAIKRLYAQARVEGRIWYPMAVRLALRLWDDSLLWSPAVAITGQEISGPAGLLGATILSTNSFCIDGGEISMTAWKPAITVADTGIGKWRKLVKAIEIYASPSLDWDGSVALRCESKQTGEPEYYLRVSADGTSQEMAASTIPECQAMRLLAAITDVQSFVEGTVATVGINPVTDNAGGSLTEDTYSIDVPPIATTTKIDHRPAAFSPRLLTTIGNRCFAADADFLLPTPPSYASLCNPDGFAEEVATTTVAVELLVGGQRTTQVRTAVASYWSKRLNGLIAYPDSRAVKITVAVTAGGKNYLWESPMHPAASGNYSYAFAEEDSSFELRQATTLPDFKTDAGVERNPSLLLTSQVGNPLVWQEQQKAANRGVRAILPAYGYGSSWQLGRHSAYLFAAEGIYLLSFDKDGGCTGESLLSKRTIASSVMAATAADGVVFLDESGALCRLTGSKVAATGIMVDNAKAVGFSIHFNEIWIAGRKTIIVECNNRFYYRDTPSEIINLSGQTMLVAEGTIMTAEQETPSDAVNIELLAPAIEMESGKRAEAVLWDVDAAKASLRFTVYGENGHSCCGRLISAISVKGNIGSPLCHRFAPLWARTVRLGISGTVPSSTLIRPAKMFYL